MGVGEWVKSGLARQEQRIYRLRLKFQLEVEFDEASQRWSVVFPELPGCATAGDTREEAISNVSEALEFWLEPESWKTDSVHSSR